MGSPAEAAIRCRGILASWAKMPDNERLMHCVHEISLACDRLTKAHPAFPRSRAVLGHFAEWHYAHRDGLRIDERKGLWQSLVEQMTPLQRQVLLWDIMQYIEYLHPPNEAGYDGCYSGYPGEE